MKNNISFRNGKQLECEKFGIFLAMMAVGGFFGAYTYTLKGGVFCNAQTANILIFGICIGKLNFSKAAYYLIPITAYLIGTILSELLPKKINSLNLIRWDTFLVGFEISAVFIMGFIPDSTPPQICQVAINFIAAMQYNTFRQTQNITMATTFCTNHLRQTGVYFIKWIHKKDTAACSKMLKHILMIFSFIAGASAAAILGSIFGGKAIWFSELLLIAVFIDLLHADLCREKGMLSIVPHGH